MMQWIVQTRDMSHLLVRDVGTCKTNNAVMARSCSYVVKLFTEASKVSDDADDILNILDPLLLKSSGQGKVINIKQVEEEDTVDDAVDY